jgi:uncharacterized protein YaaQ
MNAWRLPDLPGNRENKMFLLVLVIQREDAPRLTNLLIERGYRLTQINTIGGFLASGNVALLMGVEEQKLAEVEELIASACSTRHRFVNATPWMEAAVSGALSLVTPLEVEVGGAVVFALPVTRFLRLQGGTMPPAADRVYHRKGASAMMASDEASTLSTPADETAAGSLAAGTSPARNLIVVVVQHEDADTVTNALLGAGHRLTRINTAGGFFRRGNATLLIGVDPGDVDPVLAIIQQNTRPRTEPNPIEKGSPMYGATIFVLDVSRFLRV